MPVILQKCLVGFCFSCSFVWARAGARWGEKVEGRVTRRPKRKREGKGQEGEEQTLIPRHATSTRFNQTPREDSNGAFFKLKERGRVAAREPLVCFQADLNGAVSVRSCEKLN